MFRSHEYCMAEKGPTNGLRNSGTRNLTSGFENYSGRTTSSFLYKPAATTSFSSDLLNDSVNYESLPINAGYTTSQWQHSANPGCNGSHEVAGPSKWVTSAL